ncbi:MAG: ABC transporter permease [Clostridia bacterium]|uniref:ABC transporter permease n=1 Tax=Bianquea renquensis TaxID=2763661 RepID=A0A926DTT6_9FIRM|nr:ABC transporter permease [Bianquea renquensis]MBC8543607.1 ABC transporter permease [Bianquea renquensis]
MGIVKYIGKRVLTLIPVLLGITILAFILNCMTPGDPVEMILTRDGDVMPTQEQIDIVTERLGLNDPYPIQYLKWLKNSLTGEFGQSFVTNKSISSEMVRRLPYTLKIAVLAMGFTVVMGLGLGILMAAFRDSWVDRILRSLTTIMLSIPGFWLAILLIFLFCEKWQLLPSSGYSGFASLLLPSFSVACSTIGVSARLTRTSILDELGRQYITVAKAKGLKNKAVVIRHALPGALIPIMTFLGTYFAGILGGSTISEMIFGIPGIGSYALDAVKAKDFPVIQAYVLYTGLVYVAANLLIDILYIVVNPKIRVGEKAE